MSATLDRSEILAREERDRRWAVPLAALAALLPLAASITVSVGIGSPPLNQLSSFVVFNGRIAVLTIASVLQTLGTLALAGALFHLYRATRSRRPRMPAAVRYLILVGGVGAALVGTALQSVPPFGIVFQLLFAGKVGHFASTGAQTYQDSVDLFRSGAFPAVVYGQLIATFGLISSLAILSLNAMRVGLLPKIMGYVGLFVAALVILPLGGGLPVLQAFWLLALAALFAGRWPGGLPPAWKTGQAEPWPTMQEQREAAAAARGGAAGEVPAGRRSGAATGPSPAAAPAVPPAEPSSSGDGPPRPGAARRKRKKRR